MQREPLPAVDRVVAPCAAAAESEGETHLGVVRTAFGGLSPTEAGYPPTLVRCASIIAGYQSEEPIAGKPHDGICGGESQQWLSYPTFVQKSTLRAGRPENPSQIA